MTDIALPTFTDTVDQRFFIEPFGGPSNPSFYLDRFPEEAYNKAPDSHLVRFMYSLLGPAGVGWLHKNSLDAKLRLYAIGLELFDMEGFYGDPMRFARILEERANDNAADLLTREEWDTLKAKDESYRTRAILFLNAVRLGNTPEGMTLAARSGLHHNAEVVEHYKWLFDNHSDESKGFRRYGASYSPAEFVIVPRQEVARSDQQQIVISGGPTYGTFHLNFEGYRTTALYPSATLFDIQSALESLQTVGAKNVKVTGGGYGGFGSTYSLVTNFGQSFTNWTFLLGSSANWTFGAQLGVSSTNQTHAIYPNSQGMNDRFVLTVNLNGTSASTELGVVFKRNGTNYLIFNYNKNSNVLQILKYPGGSVLASTAYTGTGVIYLRGTVSGNDLTLEVFTTDPVTNTAATAAASISYTLAGTDITTYGVGVSGGFGVNTAGSSVPLILNLRRTSAYLTDAPIYINFRNNLANQSIGLITAENYMNTGTITVTETQRGETADDVVRINAQNQHAMQKAIDYLKPVNAFNTTSLGTGTRNRQNWKTVKASSTYSEVVRYVTGQTGITWPSDKWIEKGIEKEAQRSQNDLQHHYAGFAAIANTVAYNEGATNLVDQVASTNYHVGTFNTKDAAQHPALAFFSVQNGASYAYTPDRALADYFEPLTVTANTGSEALVNGIYPISYAELPGAPAVKYKDEQFWSSLERDSGTEYLELDFGQSVPVNYLVCEIIHKPLNIDVEYDALGVSGAKRFISVTPKSGRIFNDTILYDPSNNSSWQTLAFEFDNEDESPVVTRYLRLKFTRRTTDADGEAFSFPWSVNVRNLRVGRNVVLT